MILTKGFLASYSCIANMNVHSVKIIVDEFQLFSLAIDDTFSELAKVSCPVKTFMMFLINCMHPKFSY